MRNIKHMYHKQTAIAKSENNSLVLQSVFVYYEEHVSVSQANHKS